MEFHYVHHAGVVIAMFFEERLHQCRRDSSAARDGKMRRPGPLLDRQIAGQSGLIHALVQLKEMRMGVTNADPEDVRHPFFRKGAKSGHRQEKMRETRWLRVFP